MTAESVFCYKICFKKSAEIADDAVAIRFLIIIMSRFRLRAPSRHRSSAESLRCIAMPLEKNILSMKSFGRNMRTKEVEIIRLPQNPMYKKYIYHYLPHY